MWPAMQERVRGRRVRRQGPRQGDPHRARPHDALGQQDPRVALPAYEDRGEILRWLLLENVPGAFPYTAGVFPFKRENEDPTRMFAGEGDRTAPTGASSCSRAGMPAKRLSTAFDSVTLYGKDPARRPDIYGKVGNSGVLDRDARRHEGALLRFRPHRPGHLGEHDDQRPRADDPGFFMNTAIDQQVDKFVADNGRQPTATRPTKIAASVKERARHRTGRHPEGRPGPEHLHLLDRVRLTVMGDIAEYFIDQGVRNFYSVSISGYHIAEAGANPISQLAFTLANGFTFVEDYLARGMKIDDFAPNLSFFFSNGMDPEYTVMGRVARRIWAVAMRDRYGANERSQKLKYHIQTSGRSLHAQEIAVQRHPHDPAGADRDLRQLQLAAHQRLRRGDHDADRGERAAGDGDPADHQPRVGPGEEREPAPGRVHHRGADRAGRGSGARRVRAISERGGVLGAMETATSAARSRRRASTTRCSSTPASCRSSASTPSATRTATRCCSR